MVGVSSVAPPPVTGTNGYTQAVEKATMRECANRSATIAGTSAFIAQVRCSAPVEPNLRPAMKTTFGAAGRRATAARSRRSHSIVCTPTAVSADRRPGSLKRATPITSRSGTARFARRASVGPILPPTPSSRMSPGARSRSATSAADGVVITSSRCSTDSKRSGSRMRRPRGLRPPVLADPRDLAPAAALNVLAH